MINKVITNEEALFYWQRGDLHTNFGMVKERDIIKKKKVKTNMGIEFNVLDAKFIDKMQAIKRGPQAILEKDIGIILVNISLENDAKVLEAGAGSGKLTAFLAKAVPNGVVYSYEIRNDFFELAKRNLDSLGIKNVALKNKDVYKGIDEKNLDAVILDLPEPWRATKQAEKALKNGAFLVAYLPTITQVMEFVNEAKKNKALIFVKTIEIIERPWFVDGKKVRPMSDIIGHTAFITFVRKI